jgi:hypothetical protein
VLDTLPPELSTGYQQESQRGMSSSLATPAAGSESRPSEYLIPPLAAIFLTHFHDTKGQTVVYYISNNETSTSFLPPPRILEY